MFYGFSPIPIKIPASYLFFGSTGIWTQGFALSEEVLYHLSHSSSPPGSYFVDINKLFLKFIWRDKDPE
jgi:hypothetical protein